MKTIKDEAFLRRITLSLILCSIILVFDFALSENTWRAVRSQEPRLPDADRVRHCTRQTPEMNVLLAILFGCFWYPYSFRHVNVKKAQQMACFVVCEDREINRWTSIR